MATPTITAPLPVTLTDSDLMLAVADQFEIRRVADATITRLTAEIAERSRPTLAPGKLTSRMLVPNTAGLLVTLGRIAGNDASKFVKVADATTAGMSITGETIPPRYPHLAEVFATGVIPL